MSAIPLISREKYDGYTRAGTSRHVHSLRVGTRRWCVEFFASAICVRLGAVSFQAGLEWIDD